MNFLDEVTRPPKGSMTMTFTRKEWEDIALSIGYDLEVNGQTMSFDLHADLSNIKDRIEKNLGIE